ncbi:MAG: nucleotidyl transferase AbiEii/AbiGii toxin family protein [Solirubrobacterales bacterium]
MDLTTVQIIEFFHLSFLEALSGRVEPTRYVLKGGASLRYFFGSVRYSEDIDLDILDLEPWKLADKVSELLCSPTVALLVRPQGLSIGDVNPIKQTDTTLRWKVAIDVSGRSKPVRTKIEFSNRNGEERYELEKVRSEIVERYALRPPNVQHYTGDAPTEQKVCALVGRSETQARDVFDLELLLRRRPLPAGSLDAGVLTDAAERALELPFTAFKDQVVRFLEPAAVELYDSQTKWEDMQTFVAQKLQDAR